MNIYVVVIILNYKILWNIPVNKQNKTMSYRVFKHRKVIRRTKEPASKQRLGFSDIYIRLGV